jgi:hypothetical protein
VSATLLRAVAPTRGTALVWLWFPAPDAETVRPVPAATPVRTRDVWTATSRLVSARSGRFAVPTNGLTSVSRLLLVSAMDVA